MNWKTYLVMYYGSENIKPSDVAQKLEALGFETTFGSVDFIFPWEKQPTKEQVLSMADEVTNALRGSGAVFNLDTHD